MSNAVGDYYGQRFHFLFFDFFFRGKKKRLVDKERLIDGGGVFFDGFCKSSDDEQ